MLLRSICYETLNFLFPKFKLKGCWFDDVRTIQKIVTVKLKAIAEEEYKQALNSLVKGAQQYINPLLVAHPVRTQFSRLKVLLVA